jgi:hypothetical protein
MLGTITHTPHTQTQTQTLIQTHNHTHAHTATRLLQGELQGIVDDAQPRVVLQGAPCSKDGQAARAHTACHLLQCCGSGCQSTKQWIKCKAHAHWCGWTGGREARVHQHKPTPHSPSQPHSTPSPHPRARSDGSSVVDVGLPTGLLQDLCRALLGYTLSTPPPLFPPQIPPHTRHMCSKTRNTGSYQQTAAAPRVPTSANSYAHPR